MSSSDDVLVEGKKGRIFTSLLGPSKVYFYFEGHVDTDMFDRTMGPAGAAVLSGRATLYGDGGGWKTYESGYRARWTNWFMSNRSRLDATYLVTTSAILRMGVQVVNLFTDNAITAMKEPSELYRQLRRDVPDLAGRARGWPTDIASRIRL